MHNGTDPTTIAIGDTLVYNNLDGYIQWCKSNNSLFILTFDEDEEPVDSMKIPTMFVGEMVQGGQYSDSINHHVILRTIEDMYGLRYACDAANAFPIANCWKSPLSIPEQKNHLMQVSVAPNPFSVETSVRFTFQTGETGSLEIFDIAGNFINDIPVDNKNSSEHKFVLSKEKNNLEQGVFLSGLFQTMK